MKTTTNPAAETVRASETAAEISTWRQVHNDGDRGSLLMSHDGAPEPYVWRERKGGEIDHARWGYQSDDQAWIDTDRVYMSETDALYFVRASPAERHAFLRARPKQASRQYI
jgi:hypothetical protein